MKTPAERRAWGVSRRSVVKRADQGAWSAAPGRPDLVVLIQESNADRLQDLVPIKMGRMARGRSVDGGGSGAVAHHRDPGAALWGRASAEHRRLRCARRPPRLRP